MMQDTERYWKIRERLEQAELIVSLRDAIQSMDEGEGISLEKLEAEFGERYDFVNQRCTTGSP
jgi:hypothetical protein